ncbi:MAG: hypothetical protein ACR2LX_05485 [Jatrophihabitans sp.]
MAVPVAGVCADGRGQALPAQDYTHTVPAFLPRRVAPPLAVTATVAEITLGLALLLGIQLRRAALGSASLLAVYGICMTLTLPLAQQFHYNVLILGRGNARARRPHRRQMANSTERTRPADGPPQAPRAAGTSDRRAPKVKRRTPV